MPETDSDSASSPVAKKQKVAKCEPDEGDGEGKEENRRSDDFSDEEEGEISKSKAATTSSLKSLLTTSKLGREWTPRTLAEG